MKSVKKLMKKLTVVGEETQYFSCCDSETTLFLPEDLVALVARSLVENNSVSMRIMELGRSASSEIWNWNDDGPVYLDDCLYLQVSQTRKPHLLMEPSLPVDGKLWHVISVIDGGERFCPHCMDAEQAQGYFDQFRNDADTTVRCEESGSDSPYVGDLWSFAHFERVPTALYNLEKSEEALLKSLEDVRCRMEAYREDETKHAPKRRRVVRGNKKMGEDTDEKLEELFQIEIEEPESPLPDEECSVCYLDLSDQKKGGQVQLACGHRFHTNCLEKWFQRTPTPNCPMCRGEDISTIPPPKTLRVSEPIVKLLIPKLRVVSIKNSEDYFTLTLSCREDDVHAGYEEKAFLKLFKQLEARMFASVKQVLDDPSIYKKDLGSHSICAGRHYFKVKIPRRLEEFYHLRCGLGFPRPLYANAWLGEEVSLTDPRYESSDYRGEKGPLFTRVFGEFEVTVKLWRLRSYMAGTTMEAVSARFTFLKICEEL